MTDARLAEQWVETVVAVVPHARLTDQWVETVVRVVPHARLADQWIEQVRVLEAHVVKLSVVVAIKPVIYASNVSAPAVRARTVTATAIVELASVTAISPAAATVTRHRTLSGSPTAFNPFATPVNATGSTTRTRTVPSATLTRGLQGDNLATAIDSGSSQPMQFDFSVLTRQSGEPGYPAGNTGWFKWTANFTGNITVRLTGGNMGVYIAYFESSVPVATSFGQLSEISRNGMYFAVTANTYPVVNGHTYYWQVADYSGYYGFMTLRMDLPPTPADTSSTVMRARTTDAPATVGPFTNYVNIGSMYPLSVSATTRYTDDSGLLSLDTGVGTDPRGGATTDRATTISGVLTLDVPVTDLPSDVPAVVLIPDAPTVNVTNAGTGSLPGGAWKFFTAYYIGDPEEGRFTAAGPSTDAVLPTYDAPAGPATPAPPGAPDEGGNTTYSDSGTYDAPDYYGDVGGGVDAVFMYDAADGSGTDDPFIGPTDGSSVWWRITTSVPVTVTFAPIAPANGECLWEIYVPDPSTGSDMTTLTQAYAFDSADPNLAPVDFFMNTDDNVYITSRFTDPSESVDNITGAASFELSTVPGGDPAP